jgi:DNA-binding GntR family transcriptional regulator
MDPSPADRPAGGGRAAVGETGRTLAERTADVLRDRILTLASDDQPGDRLYPGRLAEDLRVSVTPVREALKTLANQGLVEFSPRRGASVARLSADDLDDLVAVLSGLEGLAIRLNGGRVVPAHLDRLHQCLAACARAIAARDIAAYRAGDDEFHRLLVASSGSPRLAALYDSLLRQAQIVEVQNPRYLEATRESLEDHLGLVDELARGELASSEKAIELHWQRSRGRLRRKYGEFIGRSAAPAGIEALPAAGGRSAGSRTTR